MISRLHFASMVSFLLLLAICHTTSAEQRILYGTTGKISQGSVLYRIDPETGRGTRVNRITANSKEITVDGMAFDTTDRQFEGQMYVHSATDSPNYPNSLFALDVTNGIASLIGETELPRVSELAIDQFGAVYGWQYGGLNQRIDDLVKFPQDGSGAMLFGESGVTTTGTIGIDFDGRDSSTLYMVNFVNGVGEVTTISTATGKGQAIRHVFNAPFICSGGKFDPDRPAPNLQYWCAEVDVDGGVNLNTRILVIDIATGLVNKTFTSNMDNLCHLAWTFDSSAAPSRRPSKSPSRKPSKQPSRRPSKQPSRRPSKAPTPPVALPPGVLPPSFWYWLISFVIGILVLQGGGAVIP